MKSVSGKKFTKLLEKHGWKLARISGSHHVINKRRQSCKNFRPFSWHSELKTGLLRHFIKVAEIDENEL